MKAQDSLPPAGPLNPAGAGSPRSGVGGWGPLLFFFGFLGGLIGWLHLKGRDQARAEHILKWGLIWTLVSVAMYGLLVVGLNVWLVQSVNTNLTHALTPAVMPTSTTSATETSSTTTSASGLYSGLSIFGHGHVVSVQQALDEVAKRPNDAKGYNDLATAYESKGDTANAIGALQQLTSHKPKDVKAWTDLANLQMTQAQNYVTQYQAAYQGQQSAASSQAFTPTGKLGTALGTNPIEQAAASTSNTATTDLYSRATLAFQNAVGSYKQLVKLEPTNAAAEFQLAQAAQTSGDRTTAIAAYKAYVTLNPDSSTAAQVRQLIKQLAGKK